MKAGSLVYETKLDKKGFDEGIDSVNKKLSKLDSITSGVRKGDEGSI